MREALRAARDGLSACLTAVSAALVLGLFPAAASAAPAQVDAFPIPGGRVASPASQITFRGVAPSQVGQITVQGSASGVHAGSIQGDSDGRGASFVPSTPFKPGETVTVTTSLNIANASSGRFTFTVATPAGGLPVIHWPAAPRVRNDVSFFHSRQDLHPAAVAIAKSSRGTAPGDIFLAPQFGPMQDGPMIVDSRGQLVWFQPLSGATSASDFQVQSYQGRPVLTWWQGFVTAGVGMGQDVIYDSSYQPVATVKAGNGLSSDLHDFQITPRGTALITAEYPVKWNSSAVRGASRTETVFDSVVQEIDIPTGLVLFQWDSLDHVPVTDTYIAPPTGARSPFDYFHLNSIQQDFDGNLLVSGRNTWAAYKVDHGTSNVIWRLGGKHSSFRLARGTYWAFQHDVRARASNDMFITLFDNSAGPPTIHGQSRGVKLFVDLKHMAARQVASHIHGPSLSAANEGDFQQLPNRNDFLGWGNTGWFNEYNSRGQLLFDGHFVDANSNYRAFRFTWTGTPSAPPAVIAGRHGSKMSVYASWNGATNVASWRIFGGPSATALRALATVRRNGFETAASVPGQKYAAVQALDSGGRVLGTAPAVAVR